MARLKDLLNEETLKIINENILGEMPSSKLMKMKWNPITDSKPVNGNTTSVNEAMYTVIDPRGNHGPLAPKHQVQSYAKKKGGSKKGYFVVASKNINKAKKLYGAAGGWQKNQKFQDAMSDLMYEGNLNEAEMDRRFMQDWEKSCKALINHLKHELDKGPKGQVRAQLQLYQKQIIEAQTVPSKMVKIIGSN